MAVTASRSFKFEDNSTVIYPKLPDGTSCRVVIVRRKLTSDSGAVFHTCFNAGKWSYRIDYPFKSATTRLPRKQFVAELMRMGGVRHAGRMVAQWSAA